MFNIAKCLVGNFQIRSKPSDISCLYKSFISLLGSGNEVISPLLVVLGGELKKRRDIAERLRVSKIFHWGLKELFVRTNSTGPFVLQELL